MYLKTFFLNLNILYVNHRHLKFEIDLNLIKARPPRTDVKRSLMKKKKTQIYFLSSE